MNLYEQSLEKFYKAVENESQNSIYYNNRALTFSQLKDFKHAEEDFEKAIDLNPEDPNIYHNRGNVYCSMNKFNEAILDYQKAISFSKGKKKKFFHSLGIAQDKNEQPLESLKSFQKALELQIDYLASLFHSGLVLFKLHRNKEALDYFTKVIQIQNNNHDINQNSHKLAYEARGKTYHALEQYEKAYEDLEKAVSLDPENPNFLFLKGVNELKLNKFSESLKSFQKAIEFGKKNSEIYNYIGMAYRNIEDFEKASSVTII